jgi:hypothetical protein
MKNFLAIILLIFGSFQFEPKSKENIVSEAENYQIYSRLLEKEKKSYPTTRALKISKITQDSHLEVYGWSEKIVGKELWSAMTDLMLKDKTSITLEPKFTLADKYDFFAPDENQLNSGMMVFSQIGYDSNKNLAIVYSTFTCQPLCGHGNYYIFTKKNGSWEQKEKLHGWIS